MSNKKIGSLTINKDRTYYEVLTVWESERQPGSYSISLGKPYKDRHAMSFGDAIRAWAGGAFLDFRIDQPRDAAQRSGGSYDRAASNTQRNDGFGSGGDDDIPFAPYDDRTV